MAKQKSRVSGEEVIQIPQIEIERMVIRVIGDSPLIVNRWSDEDKKKILDKQMKVAKKGREAKDPQRDFEETIYHHPDGGYAFPAIAFKCAAVDACRFTDGTKMTVARGAFHVEGEFVKLEGSKGSRSNFLPVAREDMVRVGMGTADIRYRAQFTNWAASIPVAYNKHALSKEQIVNLFNLAGFGVGVGEWRPEKNGQFGRFHVG